MSKNTNTIEQLSIFEKAANLVLVKDAKWKLNYCTNYYLTIKT